MKGRERLKKEIRKEKYKYIYTSSFYLFLEVLVINHFKTAIGYQGFRHTDTIGCLIVFKDACNDTWQCKCRAIECVAKFNLAIVRVAVTAFQAIGLVSLKV